MVETIIRLERVLQTILYLQGPQFIPRQDETFGGGFLGKTGNSPISHGILWSYGSNERHRSIPKCCENKVTSE